MIKDNVLFRYVKIFYNERLFLNSNTIFGTQIKMYFFVMLLVHNTETYFKL